MVKDVITKDFSYVTIGQFVGVGLQAAFYLIFAALLDPEIYGNLSYLIAIAGTFSYVSRFGLHNTVTIFQAKKNSLLANEANILAVILSAVAALILLPINELAALLSLSFSFFAMNQHNLLGLKKYKKHMLLAIFKNGLIITLPLFFYLFFEIPGILLGMAISNFLGSYNYFKIFNMKTKSLSNIKKKYKILVNNFGLDASAHLSRLLDKLIIAPLFGFVFVGIHQFNMQILFALEMFPWALYFFLLSEESSGKSHTKIVYLVIFGSFIATVIVIILSPILIEEIFPKYSKGIFPLQVLVISIIPLSISSFFSAKLQAIESTKVGITAIVRIGSLLGLLVILGQIYGLVGLSLAFLFSTILYTISLFILYKTQR